MRFGATGPTMCVTLNILCRYEVRGVWLFGGRLAGIEKVPGGGVIVGVSN